MNFNKERFIHFAQYDLTINKTFYRNIALFTFIATIGITILCFLGRYLIYQNFIVLGADGGNFANDPNDLMHYKNMDVTVQYLAGFISFMMCIFAGCWAHNLRNKQGRINELTLPATNFEKFVWHIGLMVIGGYVFSLLSLLIADGINAVLTWATYGSENGIPSLTAAVFNTIDMSFIADKINLSVNVQTNGEITTNIQEYNAIMDMIGAIAFLIPTSAIFSIAIFMLGNALKYKYNIILTYVIVQAISVVLGVIVLIIVATQLTSTDSLLKTTDPLDLVPSATAFLYIWSIINILLSVFFTWKSFQLYKKAQITSSFNK
jgi:hypothetical protein